MTSATLSSPSAAAVPVLPASPLASLGRSLRAWEFAVALLLTLSAAYLHLYQYHQHYPLWRDEISCSQLAALPTWADTWNSLAGYSSPILFPAVVRGWFAVVPAGDDAHLRLLGLVIGLGVIGAFWLCVREIGGRVPLWSLVLLGFNPLFIRDGDSVRPYGLGIFLALLTFLAVWRVVESARPGRVLLAAVVAMLSVHALFHNAILLLAVCGSGALVAVWERDGKKAALVLAVGIPAALSMLPYGPMLREQHHTSFMLYYPATLSWLWKRLSEVTGSPDPLGVWAWTVLFVGITALAAWRLFGQRSPLQREDRAPAFALFTLAAATLSYTLFLKVLNYYTQPWYYIAWLSLIAVCLDLLYARVIQTAGANAYRWRLARLAFILGFSLLTFIQARPLLLTRPTDMDLIAAEVERRAAKDDLIVHTRWECAITFCHYYHGATPLETLPPLADRRFHYYDLILREMMTENAVGPVLDRMAKTLREGHRIWLVGEPIFPPGGTVPRLLKPLAEGPRGWVVGGDYYTSWVMQASYVLEQHATEVETIAVPVRQAVSGYEDLSLTALRGWRPDPVKPDAP